MKIEVKEKLKKFEFGEGQVFFKVYFYFKEYGLFVFVLLLVYIGYRIRVVIFGFKLFFDLDMFYYFEMYKLVIQDWIFKYYVYVEFLMGIKFLGYFGFYMVQVMFYKFVYVLFGMNEFEVFKVWLFFVGVMMVIGMYLGNNCGEGFFVMFFLFIVYFLFFYFDEECWNWKKVFGLVFFFVFSLLYMGVWMGSLLGVMILFVIGVVVLVIFFMVGDIEYFRCFVIEYYFVFGFFIIVGIFFVQSGFVGIRNFFVFFFEVFIVGMVFVLIMFYGERFLNFLDWMYRFGIVVGIGIVGFLVFYVYFGKVFFNFFRVVIQLIFFYQIVVEFQILSWRYIIVMFSFKFKGLQGDSIIFIFFFLGFFVFGWKFYRGVKEKCYEIYKYFIFLFYYFGIIYFFKQVVCFFFQVLVVVIILVVIVMGEVFFYVERMRDMVIVKVLYMVFLILMLVLMFYVFVSYFYDVMKSESFKIRLINFKMFGSVLEVWIDVFLWIKNNSDFYVIVLSWWDYGYWEELSLLSYCRVVSDGGYGYDRRYIIVKFFFYSGNVGEVDLEVWGDDYVIMFFDFFDGLSDFGKFNVIVYFGGVIVYGERYLMFSYVYYNDIVVINDIIVVKVGNGYVVFDIVVDLIRGQVFKNKELIYLFVFYIYFYMIFSN